MLPKFSKVIFIIDYIYTKRDFERFGIKAFQSYAVDIEVWQVGWIWKSNLLDSLSEANLAQEDRVFYDWRTLKKALSNAPGETLYVPVIGYFWKSRKFFKYANYYNLKFLRYRLNPLPLRGPSFKTKLKGLFINASKIPSVFLVRPYRKAFPRRDAYTIVCGESQASMVSKHSMIIRGHSLDYEKYLEVRDNDSLVPHKYAVFLDEYKTFHPDNKIYGLPYCVERKHYYTTLQRYFDFFEKMTGLKVVIAIYPRSEYDDYKKYFGDRLGFKYQTALLVKHSEVVLGHISTSIGLAVMNMKPIVMLDMKEFRGDDWTSEIMNSYVRLLNLQNRVAIDKRPYQQIKYLDYDREAYHNYQDLYLKSPDSPDESNWEILASYFRWQKKQCS